MKTFCSDRSLTSYRVSDCSEESGGRQDLHHRAILGEMWTRWLLWTLIGPLALSADDRVRTALDRLTQEAEKFQRAAPDLQTEETLNQRAIVVQKKSRKRKEAPQREEERSPEPEYQKREILSEYGYAALDSKETIREIRRAVAVDGERIESSDEAIGQLAAAVRSNDERQKRKLLEDFEKHGLIGTVTDFGQVLLLFHSKSRDDFEYRFAGNQIVGADRAVVVAFRQTEGAARMTVIDGKRSTKQRISGTIAFRESDYLPIRVQMIAVAGLPPVMIRQEAEVEYVESQFGVLVPASVVHREYRGELLASENRFKYKPFVRLGDSQERPKLK